MSDQRNVQEGVQDDVQDQSEQSVQENAQQDEQVVDGEQVEVSAQADTQDDAQTIDSEEDKVASLEAELAATKAQIEQNRDTVLRAKAEVENARRRAEADVEKARKFALERFAGELLPVIDNLERAVSAADADNDVVKPLLEGVEMTHKSFIDTVKKFGIELVDPMGEPFNPELHQAMSMQESADFAPNTVMAVMQKGYSLNGRLLRPAMVMVSRAAENAVDTKA